MRTGESPDSGERLLVTGASGQVGSEFIPYLRDRYDGSGVITLPLLTMIKRRYQCTMCMSPGWERVQWLRLM